MADVDVAQWLEQWVEENLTAGLPVEPTAQVHDRAKACAAEAEAAGISIAEIEEAAGDDLEAYLLRRQSVAADLRGDGASSPMMSPGSGAVVPAGGLIATDLAFEPRTLELVEFVGEMVVVKEARVVEEIVLRRASRDRIETVRDTVRHTEVEIEDARGRGVAVTGVAVVDVMKASDGERIVEGTEVTVPDGSRDVPQSG